MVFVVRYTTPCHKFFSEGKFPRFEGKYYDVIGSWLTKRQSLWHGLNPQIQILNHNTFSLWDFYDRIDKPTMLNMV